MMDDIVTAWRLFRDQKNGFWCDSMWLSDYQTPCGASNNFYSSAGTGMGLVSEAIMTELGERLETSHWSRSIQTLCSDWLRS